VARHIIISLQPLESHGCKYDSALIERTRPHNRPVAVDSADAVLDGDQSDERLARAVIEALQAGRSWANIAAHLRVPPPAIRDRLGMTDRDWQEAIVAHENACAARLDDLSWSRRS
jgi:hypothetical protein